MPHVFNLDSKRKRPSTPFLLSGVPLPIFLPVFLLSFVLCCSATAEESWPEQNPVVVLSTNFGDITLMLDATQAPISTKNFLDYVDAGQYDDTIFHRVIPGFMIQGGGFDTDLKKKPTRDPIKNEASNGLSNLRGTIAMARTSVVDSATAQFFINTVNNLNLDHSPASYGYAVFGKVVVGMDIVAAIENTPTRVVGTFANLPAEEIKIIKAARLAKQTGTQ